MSINTSNINGNAFNLSWLTSNKLPNDYISPTKKASDHSISQIISYSSSNHFSTVSSLKHQQQSIITSENSSSKSSSSHINRPTQNSYTSIKKPDHSAKAQQLPSNGSQKQCQSIPKPSVIEVSDDTTDESDESVKFFEPTDSSNYPKKSKSHKHKSKKEKHDIGSINSTFTSSATNIVNLNAASSSHTSSVHVVHPLVNDEVDHDKIIHDLKVNSFLLKDQIDL